MAALGNEVRGTVSARQNRITVTVVFKGETKDLGVFDTWEGANVSTDATAWGCRSPSAGR